ncbi:hypothetical protein P3X46_008981 [Hevea brasiliensis]|uniref:Endonuclease/exonuclease/phosphatase domain-containing protein n=1 Tax=Hevea brasiliensis TaxID=3981 RepID=A0ABQ9MPH2_HEVBR|nr:hypothetical protein P3X46_008981 [Hevea brasiliensis]
MSILAWNCQGASSSSFLRSFKLFMQHHKPCLIALFEPCISRLRADRVITSLGFSHSHCIKAMGFSGGIWLLWNDSWRVVPIFNHDQYVHVSVFMGSALLMDCSFIYASPVPNKRWLLWVSMSAKWVQLGDFNAIVSKDKRSGGSFHDFNLLDLGFKGLKFTWKRGKLQERLDKALCNSKWRLSFPKAAGDKDNSLCQSVVIITILYLLVGLFRSCISCLMYIYINSYNMTLGNINHISTWY